MNFHRLFVVISGCLLLAIALTGQRLVAAPPTETLARVHWLGMNQVGASSNATQFMKVWQLPTTKALLAQTLDKLSLAPWRCLHRNVDTNAAALLRPLLDDVVANESCLFIRQSTGQPAEWVLAVRLDDQRAALWRLNLGEVLKSLTGIPPDPAPQGRYGWSLTKHQAPNLIQLSRVGGWILLGAAQDHNGLLIEQTARIERGLPPMMPRNGSDWLEADLNPARLAELFSLAAAGREVPSPAGVGDLSHLGKGERNSTEGEGPRGPSEQERASQRARRAVEGSGDKNKSSGRPVLRSSTAEGGGEVGPTNISSQTTFNFQPSTFNDFSRLYFSMTGNGENVLTHATADFSRPLALELKPWNIPTNLIHGPLTSFTAARGLAPWLAASSAWQKLEFTPPPDQAWLWSQVGSPFQTYFAAPLPGASDQIWRLSGRLVQNGNPWLAAHAQGNFSWVANPGRLVWNDALIISPWLVPMTNNQQDYVMGGLYPIELGDLDAPSIDMLHTVLNTTNLVFYQSERTGSRVEESFFITQLFRVIFHKAQLPSDARVTLWLKNVEPQLNTTTTLITETGPAQLTLARKSDIGLTALELHLLADWLESPEFPRGLHTFLAPPQP